MNFILTAPKTLNLIASLSIITLLIKIFYLNEVSALFSEAKSLGLVIEAILASVIARIC